MATPKKLASGKWRARGYFKDPVTGNVERPSFTAPSKSEAARLVAEWEAKKERLNTPSDMTVNECLERYISVKESVLSVSTIRGYRKMQRNHYSDIGTKQLKYLTDEDMQRFVSGMSTDHSSKSVRNAYSLLSSALSMFSDRKYHVSLPARQEPVRHIPTDADIKNLIASASPEMTIAISLAAAGTIREGEISALTFGDINRETNTIHVHAGMVQNDDGEWIIKPSPKTSTSDRYIPFSPRIIELLGDGEPDERIIPKTPTAIGHAFAKLRDSLGLRCRFHDLRHYAASIMHALGVPDQYIMERGGWKSDTVLKSVYRNSLSDQSKKFADATNSHFDALL